MAMRPHMVPLAPNIQGKKIAFVSPVTLPIQTGTDSSSTWAATISTKAGQKNDTAATSVDSSTLNKPAATPWWV